MTGILVGVLGMSSSAEAELLLYEGFDYSAEELLQGQDGGVGWPVEGDGSSSSRRGWAYNTATVGEASMSYTDGDGNELVTSGNRAVISATNASTHGRAVRYATPTDASPNLGADGGQLWLSYLADPTGSVSNTILDLGFGNPTSAGNVTFRIGGFDGVWSLRSARDSVASNTNVSWDTPAFVLLMFEFPDPQDTEGVTNAYLWLNPKLNEAPDTSTADAAIEDLTGDHTFDAVYFWHARQNYGSSVFNVDELRIGTTYGSVTPIPEPGMVGLVGLGALMFIKRRGTPSAN
ncbi:hypothetical protein ACERK3_17365 [Phycisphaerales bacterium AB-hyl4]|uniref:PEP-CTERM protein-sorting domain-containing protein n=1 Tax=Natronomicrosphaera hydrolytica TaxID=3242702 RepID=A0ABV4U8V1_9BACT